jgi:hypothetical protein
MAGGKGKPKKSRAKSSQTDGRITADELFVRRDSDGNLEPIVTIVPSWGGRTIAVLPTTIGSVKGLTALDKDVKEWPLGEKIRYVTEHVVEPDFRGLSQEEVEEALTMWDLDMILIAAVTAGGPQRRQNEKKA